MSTPPSEAGAAPAAGWALAAAAFDALRSLPALPPGHRARGPHGHRYVAQARQALGALPAGCAVSDLGAALQAAIADWDYADLDSRLPQAPQGRGDAALAGLLAARLGAGTQAWIQSTPDQGAGVAPGADGHPAESWRRYRFEAAHRLPYVPEGHKCGRMHGHSFAAVPVIGCALEDVAAHARLDTAWAPLAAKLEQHCLNDIPGLDNPTSENLAAWLYAALQPALPTLRRVLVFETASCGACHADGRTRIWKDLPFDSATRLPAAGGALARLHGHSYTLRLHLEGALDERAGWVVDFGAVKQAVAALYQRLDHHPLHELPELEQADTARLAAWIESRAAASLPQLGGVELLQTPGCGALRHPAAPAPLPLTL